MNTVVVLGPGAVCCQRHRETDHGDRVQRNHPEERGRHQEGEDLQDSGKHLCASLFHSNILILFPRKALNEFSLSLLCLTEPSCLHVPHRQRTRGRCHSDWRPGQVPSRSTFTDNDIIV